MNFNFAATPTRLAVLALSASLLSGCGMFESVFSGDKIDYKNTSARSKPLEVPPDLTQIARESRYQIGGGGVVSAAAAGSAPAAAAPAASAPALVALASQGDIKVQREGQQRWLSVPVPPEQLWPQLRAFWESAGFSIEVENAQTGVMETAWSENRAKLPADAVRNSLGRLLGNLYDSGERDRYRTRVERSADGKGSEVYISHRGIVEVYTDERKENTTWRARPNDPQLEAELLSRLMLALGSKDDPARTSPTAVAAAPEGPAKARIAPAAAAGGVTSLNVEESFDRTWRRVGLALDRGGFSVEDRDRTAGLYYVRYVDPKSVGKDEPSWWSKLFGSGQNPGAPQRYRIAVKPNADNTRTSVTVQTTAGAPETGENAQRIMALLAADLR